MIIYNIRNTNGKDITLDVKIETMLQLNFVKFNEFVREIGAIYKGFNYDGNGALTFVVYCTVNNIDTHKRIIEKLFNS